MHFNNNANRCAHVCGVIVLNFPDSDQLQLLIIWLFDFVISCYVMLFFLQYSSFKVHYICFKNKQTLCNCKITLKWNMPACFWEFWISGKAISTQTAHQCTWLNTELTTCAFDICTERMHSDKMAAAKVFHLCYRSEKDPAPSCTLTHRHAV